VPVAWVALLTSLGMVAVSLATPSGFLGRAPVEWLLLALWILCGAVLWVRVRRSQPEMDERQRRALILGAERDGASRLLPGAA
jgi:FlaA1/EpsC-like NDP-sugar epimerase